MIELSDVLQWKQEYGDVYQMEIQDQNFIFRPLGREEYKEIIIMDLDIGEFQEAICFQAVIHPEDYDYSNGVAGVAEVLSDAILDASGLLVGQAKDLLEQYRAEMMNYDYQVDCLIHEAFPEFTLEEISTWPVRKTMYYLARAEWILQNLRGVQIVHIDEDMYEQMQEQQEPIEQAYHESKQNPYQREIRKELVEFEEPKKKQEKKQDLPKGAIQSEEKLLAMLAQTGQKVTKPTTDLNEVMPELNWFSYMDELKGDFD